ncbi:MAG TPA: HAD family hydrolase [Bacteroidales bacterium]|nr:HAD family hydrolase [Bacteroidales bacterium]
MNQIKSIIFDCDGVLVDTESISNQVKIDMARELGADITMNEAMQLFTGYSTQSCFQIIESRLKKALPPTFEREYRERSYMAFQTQLQPIDGVVEFINSLSIPYCVASSGPPEKISLTLTAVGLIDKFRNRIFSSYQINSWKPEPDLFLYAAKEMGFDINSTVVIEDSKAGVTAAIRGGFRVFCIENNYHSDDLQAEGAIIVKNLKEIESYLTSI